MPRKKTTEEYISDIFKMSDYCFCDTPNIIQAKTKLKLRCKSCGNIVITTYDKIRSSYKNTNKKAVCKSCSVKRTYKENLHARINSYHKRLIDLGKDDFDFQPFTVDDNGIFYCAHCGTYYLSTINRVLYGSKRCGCPKCARNYKKNRKDRVSYKSVYEKCLEKRIDIPYKPLFSIGRHSKSYYICQKHGLYLQENGSHLCGNGCPDCYNENKNNPSNKLSNSEFFKKALNLGFKPCFNYINYDHNTTFECLECHCKFNSTLHNILAGGSCPNCSPKVSHGEMLIRCYLNKHNISYISEKRFDNCVDKRPLPFDFYLPDYNTLIEYQGKQHFEHINYFYGTRNSLKDRKHKDYLKSKYAKENGYKLLRPTYKTDTQEKINRYLDRYLLKSLTNN